MMIKIIISIVIPLTGVLFFSPASSSEDLKDLRDSLKTASSNLQNTGWPRPPSTVSSVSRNSSIPMAAGLLKVANKACSGRKFDNLKVLSAVDLGRPIRFYTDKNPPPYVLGIADRECPEPLENAIFLVGHLITERTAYYYTTSRQGEIIQAVYVVGLPTGETIFEPITRITPEIQRDFDDFKKALIERYGATTSASNK